MTAAAANAPGFAIYVHWPFCLSKCPYCDFNSHVRERIEQDRWRTALLAEIDHYAIQTPDRTVTSIFFGGGTPSLMEPATVGAVIDRIARRWTLDPTIEITLEANPTSVEAHKFQGFRSAGVNRVSLGIQALDDTALKFLGRQHSAHEALGAIDLAARHFDRYSFDLIYARPDQTVKSWQAELDRALGFAADHLSVYQLTIEQGTQFATLHARGDFILPDDELAGELYELTQTHLAAAGMPSYEISNHARPGQASRHNLTYWRYGDYVGVGPGAHGRLTLGGKKWATRQAKAPETWLARVEADGHGTQETEIVDAEARAEEMLMMGLRLAEGIPRQRFRDELGLEVEDLIDLTALGHLTEGGFVTLDEQRLAATDAGRQRLNAVLAALLK